MLEWFLDNALGIFGGGGVVGFLSWLLNRKRNSRLQELERYELKRLQRDEIESRKATLEVTHHRDNQSLGNYLLIRNVGKAAAQQIQMSIEPPFTVHHHDTFPDGKSIHPGCDRLVMLRGTMQPGTGAAVVTLCWKDDADGGEIVNEVLPCLPHSYQRIA